MGYYKQGVLGQMELMHKREPITEVLQDEATSAALAARLEQVLAYRRFALQTLHLPDNGSYMHYVDLQRPYVVWNVFATPEFSLRPVQSCFPVVGCLSYRGYFDPEDAKQAADELDAKGHDVYVGGVAAYSTLGWFADPVLSSMMRWDELRLAQLIFHELAHQQLYADDDSDFNEAFATAVSVIGIRRWLDAHGSTEQRLAWQQYRQRQKDFLALVRPTAERLKKLYAVQGDAQAMREAKAEVFADLRRDYRQLRDGRWQGYDGYNHWFETVNNARIAAVATYHDWVPGFLRHYERLGEDIDAFYAACAEVASQPAAARREWLQAGLAAEG
ncbi:MAG: aminopeptidase [Salinisphaeraceae bacterium]|nr:aminopeptidase [Salinisphaeraceae bacterium]